MGQSIVISQSINNLRFLRKRKWLAQSKPLENPLEEKHQGSSLQQRLLSRLDFQFHVFFECIFILFLVLDIQLGKVTIFPSAKKFLMTRCSSCRNLGIPQVKERCPAPSAH